MVGSQCVLAMSAICLDFCSPIRNPTLSVHPDSSSCNTRKVSCKYSVAPQKQSSAPVDDGNNEGSGFSPMSIGAAAVNALFSYEPFFKFAAGQARSMIIQRGTEIGHPWAPELARLRTHDWSEELKKAQNKHVEYPSYYLKPFHAYEYGNLSWDAAWEVELAAKSDHANTFDPENAPLFLEKQILDPNGDAELRNSYHKTMVSMMKTTPHAIVDLGCATGLSTYGLHEVFPKALTVGVDLSPYFISVANFRHKERGQNKSVQFLHAAAEYTGLPSGAYDLVSLCLVCHELPRTATKQIIEEAHRLLKPGGALAIMEMNPYSPHLQRMVTNVFALTAFKAREPYFDDYRTFGIERAVEERGFTFPTQTECSPRHRTVVAHKK
ncbi:hypothetical protein Mapa_005179 [Marchantia paleacea]|nr:hypothetical protein Mapa_005179 [Marchantia paleacea]